MATIRISASAEPLFPLCRSSSTCLEDACFTTYAELIIFAASMGYEKCAGSKPSEPKVFFSNPYPVDFSIFKGEMYPIILLICLATAHSHKIAQDEDKMARVIEAYAEAGFRELEGILKNSTPADFNYTLAHRFTQALKTSES